MTMNEDSPGRNDPAEGSGAEDSVLRREEAAAAREARNIGGPRPDYENEEDLRASEAERPLFESGEGVEEGFEIAEDDLEEAATHEENRYSPEAHEFGDEESAGDADAVSGEPDEIDQPDGPDDQNRRGSVS